MRLRRPTTNFLSRHLCLRLSKTAPWWWWKARPLQPLLRGPSPCSPLAFFLISPGSASSAGHCSRSQPMHCRSSSVWPWGSIQFKPEQGRSVPSSLASYGRFRTRRGAVHFLRHPFSRSSLVIGLLFVASCGTRRLGCDLALAQIGVSPGWWREVFAIFGAVTVGCTAWARVSILTGPAPVGVLPAQPSHRWGSAWEVGPQTDDRSDPSSLGRDQRANSQAVNMTAMTRCRSHFDMGGQSLGGTRSGCVRRLRWSVCAAAMGDRFCTPALLFARLDRGLL